MGEQAPPKALLRLQGETLLQRHLDILARFGLSDLTLVVGHQAALIERELAALGARDRVRACFNPDYRMGSRLSLWSLRDVLRAGAPVLYMDADVLYDWRLLDHLLRSPLDDCILIGRGTPDPEWVEVPIRDGRIVAFDKGVTIDGYDTRAEWGRLCPLQRRDRRTAGAGGAALRR
jgi:choline kinase